MWESTFCSHWVFFSAGACCTSTSRGTQPHDRVHQYACSTAQWSPSESRQTSVCCYYADAAKVSLYQFGFISRASLCLSSTITFTRQSFSLSTFHCIWWALLQRKISCTFQWQPSQTTREPQAKLSSAARLYERPLLYDSRHIRFSPQRGYAAYDDSVTSQPSYRRQSNDDSSSDRNRDRRRGEQYYRHRSPSPQRPHSRHVHFTEQQRSGNEW